MDKSSPAYYDLTDYTDDEIIHFLESSGSISQVLIGIHGYGIDYEEEEHEAKWDEWRLPEHVGLRRAVADAYLYGMYMRSEVCRRWHQHCIDRGIRDEMRAVREAHEI